MYTERLYNIYETTNVLGRINEFFDRSSWNISKTIKIQAARPLKLYTDRPYVGHTHIGKKPATKKSLIIIIILNKKMEPKWKSHRRISQLLIYTNDDPSYEILRSGKNIYRSPLISKNHNKNNNKKRYNIQSSLF